VRGAAAELSGYYAHIEATDRAIGVACGEAAGETIVVATSVHGDMHGSHGLFRKGWPHEESVRVPLLVRLPGRRGRDERAVSLIELPGLALAWADGRGTPDAARTSGEGGFAAISMPSVVKLPDQCDRVWSGVRTPSRKLVLNADRLALALFDLARDPLERRTLPATHPARERSSSWGSWSAGDRRHDLRLRELAPDGGDDLVHLDGL
jgi:hypothetical protein